MKLLEWQEYLIKEDGAAGGGAVAASAPSTTSSAIAYIPSDVPAVNKKLTKLSRKKHKWNLEILESAYDYTLNFENCESITVSVDLWENFKTAIFGTSNLPEGEFIVDLSGFLMEAYTEELEIATQQLRNAIIQFLNSDIVASQRHKVASFERQSGSNLNFGTEGKSVIQGVNVEQQLSNFLKLIQGNYKNDIGSIQLVTGALQQRSPLTEIPLFTQYDNLISVILSGEFIYKSVVGLDFTVSESLKFGSEDIAKRLVVDPSLKVEGEVAYPRGPKGFGSNISELIAGYLKGR